MTDFFADLEAELRGAAHRRAAGVPPRRLRVRLEPVLVLAVALAAVAVVLAALGGRASDRVADEAPAPVPVAGRPCADLDGFRAPVGAPPRRLTDAIGALPRQYSRVVPLPEAATRALDALDVREAWVDAVAKLRAGGPGPRGADVYVVPVRRARPCADVKPAGYGDFEGVGACLLARRGPDLLASLCEPLRTLENGGTATRRIGGATVVLGFARDDTPVTGFENERGGREFLRPRGNIIADLVRDDDRASFPAGMRVTVARPRGAGDPRPAPRGRPGPVAILNATTAPGLAARFADRLRSTTAYGLGPVEAAATQSLRRSVVRYAAADARDDAQVVAGTLLGDGTRVESVPPADLAAPAPVVVLLGRDAREVLEALEALPGRTR